MTLQTQSQLSHLCRCAIYNELSHMTPYYLSPSSPRLATLSTEVEFHKRNIYLLSLYFDKILVCTDNLVNFTRAFSADLISTVAASSWFTSLVDTGVITLSGWGTNTSHDMMQNQIDYSARYRPKLKTPAYKQHLRALARNAHIVVREPDQGEKEQVDLLDKQVQYLDAFLPIERVHFLSDAIWQTQDSFGFVGTAELFPVVDRLIEEEGPRMASFFPAYYRSWQEYCTAYYRPAITVDTLRNRTPVRIHALQADLGEIPSSFYSPEFFQNFLVTRLGSGQVAKLTGLPAERLVVLRDSDWRVFSDRYHDCLRVASEIAWILNRARDAESFDNPTEIEALVEGIFESERHVRVLSGLGTAVASLVDSLTGTPVLGVAFKLFQRSFHRRLSSLATAQKYREFQAFLGKLNALLNDEAAFA